VNGQRPLSDAIAANCIVPDWPAPKRVRALSTTRQGGCSPAPWDSLNMGLYGGDDPGRVHSNRALLRQLLPCEPVWLRQVHGVAVVRCGPADVPDEGAAPAADAQVADTPGQVCAVLAADCLPVLLCDRSATVVAAAHAGWRGLAAGVLERTIASMAVRPQQLLAWLGPAIGPQVYEVGDEVRRAFADGGTAAGAFRPHGQRWLLDLYAMARYRLALSGVTAVWGGDYCTFTDARRFFSHRRDAATGRMASLIWLADDRGGMVRDG